jgi:putative membrane-bound dehydrogenase-like protein
MQQWRIAVLLLSLVTLWEGADTLRRMIPRGTAATRRYVTPCSCLCNDEPMNCTLFSARRASLRSLPLFACGLLLAAWAGSRALAAEGFAFQPNDVVAIYGNGLADRMQHDPWVEAVLQAQLKGMNLRFRNMSFAGDMVNKRPRNEGFTNDAEYLQHVAPDVVFTFYGYNESFGGSDSADAYRDELVKLVERSTALRREAGKDLRFVLFSPIACENTGSPHLPDGAQLNANLAAYTEATRQAAEQAGVTFVDLFTPTQQLFADPSTTYTLNGIHLNAAGYEQLAAIISEALLGTTVAVEKDSPLYRAVEDKNWHWHNRYRATDGNDIWGGRSTLTFVDGQSNADVLKHELVMLDVMTANRDEAIWAAAEGRPYTIDDSNVPPPVMVISNVGGGSASSSAEKEGTVDYLSPEESLAKIRVPEGYELNVFASEVQFPDLANPVQLQVDAKGRLWAASWNTYPKWEPGKEMNDSLMIFEDTDGDGMADVRKIFAHVHNPLGFEFWNNGVLVTSGPDLWFLQDIDGDDVADVRYPILQGLGTADTHHAANNLIYGPDGGIYWQSGIFLVHNHETPWKQNLNVGASGMYRFDPRTFAITPHAGNSPNPHGTSFDRWGYCYANDGTGGRSFQVRPEGTGFKMFELLTKEFRPVAADEILSSQHFPDELQQDFLICNTIGFLGVKQYDLDREGGENGRKFGEVWGTPGIELLNSEDRNFRPTDAIVGSDGALYVADWHNAIIGHMQHNIRDPNRDHVHGRIFRLTVKDRPLQAPVKIAGEPIEALLENLKHPVDGVRHRTRVELSGRDSQEVIAAVREWMKAFDPNDEVEAHHLLEALWLHQQHGERDEKLLDQLLSSDVKHAVVAANTVKHFWFNVDATGAEGFMASPELEFVNYKPPKHLSRAEKKVYKLGAEIYQREAHCATCHLTHGKGNANVYPPLVDSGWVLGDEERLIKATLHGLWGKMTVNGTTYDPSRGVPPMTAFRSLLNDEELAAVLTFVRNTWGNEAAAVLPETVARVREQTSDRSIFFKPEELLAEHPLEAMYREREPSTIPEEFSNEALEQELLASDPAELARLAMDRGNVQRGKKLFYESSAACFACHDPPKGAARLGPDLVSLTTTLSQEQLVDSLLRPSKLIDKAYAQVSVLDVNGQVRMGIRVSENDQEIVLRNLAAPDPITIPKADIDELEESEVSLMPENLMRQLKSRREFDDLLRYVLEVRGQ